MIPALRLGHREQGASGHALNDPEAIEAILAARSRGGPFKSMFEFCERVDLRAVTGENAVLLTWKYNGTTQAVGLPSRTPRIALIRLE